MSETVDEVDSLTLEQLRQGFRTFVAMTMRLGDVSDPVSRATIVRLLTSTDTADPLPDLERMVIRALDERDELRRRVSTARERLERLAGQSYTAAILRGEA